MATTPQRIVTFRNGPGLAELSQQAEEFAAFYRAEQPGQVRRAALMLGSNDVANDVVHDAFVSLYKRWASIREPGPYLNRAVLNGCRAIGRERSAAARLNRRLGRQEPTQPPDVLFDVLQRLPFNHRAVVVLRFYVGMTERDIASTLDVPSGSIGPWIKRALRTMEKELS